MWKFIHLLIFKIDMDTEIWKTIQGYESYEVSSFGNVRNINSGRILKPTLRSGYQSLSLSKENVKKTYSIHTLVASHFLEKPSEDAQIVNHKNGMKTDNHISNLEWVTHSQNAQHAIQTGLKSIYKRSVVQMDLNGNSLQTFQSILDASKFCNVDSKKISAVCLGQRKTTGGFKWKYIDEIDDQIDLTKFYPIPGYTKYLISKDGEIYSLFTKKCLSPKVSEDGVLSVDLCEHKKKTIAIHIIVAKTFIPNTQNKKSVIHINKNKNDNSVINLQWI